VVSQSHERNRELLTGLLVERKRFNNYLVKVLY